MRTRLLLALAMTVVFVSTAFAETRFALVIGNGAYDSSPLSDPPRDAELMARTLRSLGFQVTKEVNQGRKAMRNLIHALGEQLSADSNAVGLFYYSGHGMQVDGRNYMVPVDADIRHEVDVRTEAIDLNSLLGRMGTAKNRLNIVVLDACRNNSFEKSIKSDQRGLNDVSAPAGSIIAFAAEPHKVALQGSGQYSQFTEALAAEMVKPNVHIGDIFTRARISVYRRTNQQQLPTVDNRMLLERFYLASGDSTPVTPSPASDQCDGHGASSVTLRRTPAELTLAQLRHVVQRYGFTAGIPRDGSAGTQTIRGTFSNDFERKRDMVVDCATGLMWQRSTVGPFTIDQADAHIRRLNRDRYEGYSDWRLPTVEELMSLTQARGFSTSFLANGIALHLDPSYFHGNAYFCMSSDRMASEPYRGMTVTITWAGPGYLGFMKSSNSYPVKAVRTLR